MLGFSLESYFSWVGALRRSAILGADAIESFSRAFEAPEVDQLRMLEQAMGQLELQLQSQDSDDATDSVRFSRSHFSELVPLLKESLFLFQGKMKDIQVSTAGAVAESLLALMAKNMSNTDQDKKVLAEGVSPADIIRWERQYLRAVALSRLSPHAPFAGLGQDYEQYTDGDLWRELAKASSGLKWKIVSARCHIQLGFLLMHRCAFSNAQIRAQSASSLGVDLDQYTRTMMNNLLFTCAIHLDQDEIASASLSLLRKLGNATPSQRLADLNRMVSYLIAFDRIQAACTEMERFEQLPAVRSSYSAISYALLLKNKIVLQLAAERVGSANELLLNLSEHLYESGLPSSFLELFFEQSAILFLDGMLGECVELSRTALVRAEQTGNELLELQAFFFLVMCGHKGIGQINATVYLSRALVIAQQQSMPQMSFVFQVLKLADQIRERSSDGRSLAAPFCARIREYCWLNGLNRYLPVNEVLSDMLQHGAVNAKRLMELPATFSNLSFFPKIALKHVLGLIGSIEFVEFAGSRKMLLDVTEYLSEQTLQSSIFIADGAKSIWYFNVTRGQVHSRSVDLTASLGRLFSSLFGAAKRGMSAEDIHAIGHNSHFLEERHGAAVASQISRLRRALVSTGLLVHRRNGIYHLDSPVKRVLFLTGRIIEAGTTQRKLRASPNSDKILALFSKANPFLTTAEIIAATGIPRQNVHRTLQRSVQAGLLRPIIQGRSSGYVVAADMRLSD
jgi:hypothetical protein